MSPLDPLGGAFPVFFPGMASPVDGRRAVARAGDRAQRPTSRASSRRQLERRPARPAARRQLERVAVRKAPAARSTSTRAKRSTRVARSTRRTVAHKVARAGRRVPAVRSGLAAVAAWARGNIGGRYVRGGTGDGGYDCSGFTRAAYLAAGIRLPRTSGAQAARTVPISRRQARPGDLVIGPGHVGIYAGGGMMWDFGNPRVDGSYRPLYRGLRIGRVRS